tara:strand:- start:25517 stop:28156 length:2640 start_codon:yes stop_codon:yes gene_type:complete
MTAEVGKQPDNTYQWTVQGMDCPSCAGKIRGAVERLKGVYDVRVSVMKETLTLGLDTQRTSTEQVEKTVKRLGYGVQFKPVAAGQDSGPDESHSHGGCDGSHDHDHDHDHGHCHGHDHDHDVTMATADEADTEGTLSWKVGGMDCASCAAKIRGGVENLPGVSGVKVSVMNETLTLKLDEQQTSPDSVEKSVKRLGYSVTPRTATTGNGSNGAGSTTDEGAAEAASATPKRWFQHGKGRLVVMTGAVLLAAVAVRLVVSESLAYWGFILACLVGLVPVSKRAFSAARAGMPFTIEMLMTIAAGGALFIGAAEEAALVVFLFAVGEVLEGVAADRARSSIRALGDLVPKTALVEDAQGATSKVNAANLKIGQVVVTRPGDRIPADGQIIEGTSSIDESPVTGESVPKSKTTDESVFAGSINNDAVLRIRVTKAPEDNTIARIIRLVEEAQEARAPTERFIDRFSRIYMPAVVGTAILVAIIPPLFFGGVWGEWVYRALALLLIGCPCALVISVPASIASSLSTGARRGLLMKGGAVIESTAKASLVTFDKTGTLTAGKPVVTDVQAASDDYDEADVIALAASVEAGSSHPLAEAVLNLAESRHVAFSQGTDARVIAGHGVEASVDGHRSYVGSPRYAEDQGVLTEALRTRIAALEEQGKTAVVVFKDGAIVGLIAMRDEPRADAAQGIKDLQALGIRSVMLTGDNPRTAKAIADPLGIEFQAGLLPDDKVTAIKGMVAKDRVIMVGDGINDAPALATAHVGVAMGSGTDVALETADGALLRNRVTDIATMIRLARASMNNIRQNIIIALGLKAVFLLTTMFGLTGLWLAIMADTGATVLVTLNALRLLRFENRQGPTRGGGASADTSSKEPAYAGSTAGV